MPERTTAEFAADVRRWLVDADWVMRKLDVSRSTLTIWITTGVAPRPTAVLGGVRLWDSRLFENITPPRMGRPPKGEDVS